jgi:hypothetical protein
LQGPKGDRGEKGDKGDRGDRGERGEAGQAGQAARPALTVLRSSGASMACPPGEDMISLSCSSGAAGASSISKNDAGNWVGQCGGATGEAVHVAVCMKP